MSIVSQTSLFFTLGVALPACLNGVFDGDSSRHTQTLTLKLFQSTQTLTLALILLEGRRVHASQWYAWDGSSRDEVSFIIIATDAHRRSKGCHRPFVAGGENHARVLLCTALMFPQGA